MRCIGVGMRCFVVVNPAACRGGRAGTPAALEAALRAHALPFEMVRTTRAGEAASLVAEHGSAFDAVVVCGGDGTIHEVLQSLDLERHILGVVPAGTGNDFAWMNGWPSQVEACVERVAMARERRVDLGAWNGRRFHNSIGLGFEGRVNYESHRIRRLRGPAVYLAAVARTLAQRTPAPLRFEWDGGSWEGEVFMASVCIGRRVGGAFRLAPQARNDDGLFDLCFVRDLDLWRILALLPRTFSGAHLRSPHVRALQTPQLRIEAPQGIPVHVDGEFVALDVRLLELRCLPGALRTF